MALREHQDMTGFFALEQQIAMFLKHLPPYFVRLNENANRLFYESSQHLNLLEVQLAQERKRYQLMENLLVAQHRLLNHNLLAGLFQTRGYRQAQQAAVARALDWLDVVDLRDCANRLAGTLPYGYQRRVEIARAMCTQPQLVCLDEPAAGLNPRETEELAALIQTLRAQHSVTVFLIEHDMGLVMGISDHIVVLDYGRVIAAGTPAYLGVAEEETAAEAHA